MENTVNEELKNVSDWLKANKLSLNIKKTKLIKFKAKNKKIRQETNIKLDDSNISRQNRLDSWELACVAGAWK